MLPLLNISVERSNDAERFVLRLPADLKGQFSEFGGRTVITATTRRESWRADSEVLLDFSTSFLNWVVGQASAEQFGGSYAAIQGDFDFKAFAAFLARYQNDQGHIQNEQLFVVRQNADETLEIDNQVVRRLLAGLVTDAPAGSVDSEKRKKVLEAARDRVEVKMVEELTRFKHPNDLVLLAAAECSRG